MILSKIYQWGVMALGGILVIGCYTPAYGQVINDPPQVEAFACPDVVSLDGSPRALVDLADSQPVFERADTILWTVASGPGPMAFDNPAKETPKACFTVAGVYVLVVTATNAYGSVTDTVTVTVN